MSIASVAITFRGPSPEVSDLRCIRIDQDNTRRTKCPGGGYDLLNALLRRFGFKVSAGTPADGVFRVPILSQGDEMGHNISISHGRLSDPVETIKILTESVSCSPTDFGVSAGKYRLELDGKLKWRPDKLISVNFAGSVRDASGASVAAPATEIDGTAVICGYPVYGQMTVRYQATITERTVEIPPRDTAKDNSNYYQSTIIIQSECGGTELVDIEVPKCFEHNIKEISRGKDVGHQEDELEAAGADLNLSWDECTMVLEDDSLGVYAGIKGKVCYPGVPCAGQSPNCSEE